MFITKFCPKCEQDKATCEFHKNRSNKDGLDYRCKLCKKQEENILKHLDRDWETHK